MAQQVEYIKWIDGTNFMVDGFNFQNARCKNYFLTHFHSDHTTGEMWCLQSVFVLTAIAEKWRDHSNVKAPRMFRLSYDFVHVFISSSKVHNIQK